MIDQDALSLYVAQMRTALDDTKATITALESRLNEIENQGLDEIAEFAAQTAGMAVSQMQPQASVDNHSTDGQDDMVAIEFNRKPGYLGENNTTGIARTDGVWIEKAFSAAANTLTLNHIGPSVAVDTDITEGTPGGETSKPSNGVTTTSYKPQVIEIDDKGHVVSITSVQDNETDPYTPYIYTDNPATGECTIDLLYGENAYAWTRNDVELTFEDGSDTVTVTIPTSTSKVIWAVLDRESGVSPLVKLPWLVPQRIILVEDTNISNYPEKQRRRWITATRDSNDVLTIVRHTIGQVDEWISEPDKDAIDTIVASGQTFPTPVTNTADRKTIELREDGSVFDGTLTLNNIDKMPADTYQYIPFFDPTKASGSPDAGLVGGTLKWTPPDANILSTVKLECTVGSVEIDGTSDAGSMLQLRDFDGDTETQLAQESTTPGSRTWGILVRDRSGGADTQTLKYLNRLRTLSPGYGLKGTSGASGYDGFYDDTWSVDLSALDVTGEVYCDEASISNDATYGIELYAFDKENATPPAGKIITASGGASLHVPVRSYSAPSAEINYITPANLVAEGVSEASDTIELAQINDTGSISAIDVTNRTLDNQSGSTLLDFSGSVLNTSGNLQRGGTQLLTTQQTGLGSTLASSTAGATYGATEQTMLQDAHDKIRILEGLLKTHGLVAT